MCDLSEAEDFKMVGAVKHPHGRVDEATLRTSSEHYSVNRWTKHGHDRLYINTYVDDGYIDLDDGTTDGFRIGGRYEFDEESERLYVMITDKTTGDFDAPWIQGYAILVVEVELPAEPRDVDLSEGEPVVTARSRECEQCGETFGTDHGLATHRGIVHSSDSERDSSAEEQPEAGSGPSPAGNDILADGGREVPERVDSDRVEELAKSELSETEALLYAMREEDYSREQMTTHLGVERGTVNSHLARARQKIQDAKEFVGLLDIPVGESDNGDREYRADNDVTVSEFIPASENPDADEAIVRVRQDGYSPMKITSEETFNGQISEKFVMCNQCGENFNSVYGAAMHLSHCSESDRI